MITWKMWITLFAGILLFSVGAVFTVTALYIVVMKFIPN